MTVEKIAYLGAGLLAFAALALAFLAITSTGLDERLAFGSLVGLLLALIVLGLGRYKP